MQLAENLISVVMPAYNAEKTIGAAIESVLSQTYSSFELIVINDCAKDGTENIARRYAQQDARVKVISNHVNSGVSITRKKGVEAAKGDWIAFLDSDDIWKPDKLEKQIALQKKKQADLVFTGSAFIDAEGRPVDWILHVPEQIQYRKLLKQNLVSNSSVLIRKQCYLDYAVAGDEMHEDFACWLNFLKTGKTAYGIDEPLLVYRLSATSKSGNKLKAARMNWNTYRAVGLNLFQAAYYQFRYMVNGIRKYRSLKIRNG